MPDEKGFEQEKQNCAYLAVQFTILKTIYKLVWNKKEEYERR